MLPPVYAALSADSAVAALVATRIYSHGEAPQEVAMPYVTWQMIAGIPENNLSDAPDIDRCTLQVNCWHPTGAGINDLAEAVRAVLEQNGHVTNIPVNERDEETRLYWIALEMDWFLTR